MFVHLDPISQISGLLALILNLIVLSYGGLVLYKAIEKKDKRLFYFFLAVIFMMSGWYPSGFGYLYWLFTGNVFTYAVYVLIGTIFIPIAIISWLEIYLVTLHPKKKNIVLICMTILSIIFYIYLFYFLFYDLNPNMIGKQEKPNDMSYRGFVLIFMVTCVFITLITGIHFSIVSMRVKENPTVMWKGRIILLSFILFAIGGLGDALVQANEIIVIILFRVLLVLSSTFFYIGFIMPKWMKKILSLE